MTKCWYVMKKRKAGIIGNIFVVNPLSYIMKLGICSLVISGTKFKFSKGNTAGWKVSMPRVKTPHTWTRYRVCFVYLLQHESWQRTRMILLLSKPATGSAGTHTRFADCGITVAPPHSSGSVTSWSLVVLLVSELWKTLC